MTIIAAYKGKDRYWIGSDSLSSTSEFSKEKGSKLIKKNNYYLGYTYSYRVADIIEESKKLPKNISSIKDIRDFRDILMNELIEKAGVGKESKINEETVTHPVGLIFITKIGIFEIQSDYQITKINDYAATGSGSYIAYGSLYNSKRYKHSGKEAVIAAIKASIEHNPFCGGKIYTASIKRK